MNRATNGTWQIDLNSDRDNAMWIGDEGRRGREANDKTIIDDEVTLTKQVMFTDFGFCRAHQRRLVVLVPARHWDDKNKKVFDIKYHAATAAEGIMTKAAKCKHQN